MTKKDYILIANVIAKHGNEVSHPFVLSLCSELKEDNASFNKQRFIDYINDNRKWTGRPL